jgi:tellurite resistance protein TerC
LNQPVFWIVFNLFVLLVLAVDLLILNRPARPVKFREALAWSLTWISLAAGFALLLYFRYGHETSIEFAAAYLVEFSLSVDNLFIFLLLFRYFRVPADLQHKVLSWGILGALLGRGAFILLGIELIQIFHWVFYGFGVFVVASGVQLFRHRKVGMEVEKNPALRWFRRWIPVTEGYEGEKFFVRRRGLHATPLLLVLLVIETTDLLLTTDSIPAAFAITLKPFILYTSNVFAVLGLRSLFFVLAEMMEAFAYLHYGLSLVLVFIGAKMLAADYYPIPTKLALAIVAGVLLVSVLASLVRTARVRQVTLR